MSADVLGVHGIWNYRPVTPDQAAVELAIEWGSSLNLVAADAIAAAYYAHHLRLGSHSTVEDLDAINGALGGLPRELLEAWMYELGFRDEGAQGRGGAPTRQLVSWFVQRFGIDGAVIEKFISVFLTEVSTYLHPTDRELRHAVRSTIAAAISTHQPRVIVAHSLGSIAAYETLWAYPQLTVELLITIGSPLAIPHRVFPLLEPQPIGGRGTKPPGVRRWANFADVGDVVAVPKHLVRYFDGIDVDQEIVTGWLWTHGVAAYLRDSQLQSEIRAVLQSR